MQYWWLNAMVGSQNWDVSIVEKGNEIVGVLPYCKKKKLTFQLINVPKLTQHLGPWIIYPKGQKYFGKLSHEKEIINQLVEQLPNADAIYIKSNYAFTNWLPFHWLNYTQTTRYTYVLDDISNTDLLYENLSSGTRKNLKKAQKSVHVIEDSTVDELYRLNSLTFKRQNATPPFSISLLKQLDAACFNNNARKVFLAKDDEGKTHAALYLVWNSTSAHYLIGGGDPELRKSEAMTLLMWEAIKFASTVTKKFDFEGSMLEPIERFFRGFGAVQKPYFKLTKYNSKALGIVAPILYPDL